MSADRVTRVRTAACTAPSAIAGRISAPIARAGSPPTRKSACRNEPQTDREEEHEKDRQPEVRHRNADLAQAHHDRIACATAPICGVDARGQRDKSGDRHRHERKRRADRQARGDQRTNRRAVGVGKAEIAVKRPADPVRVTDGRRLIEAELVRQSRDRLGRRGRPQDSLRRIPRQNVHDREDDQRREQERRHEQSYTLGGVKKHRHRLRPEPKPRQGLTRFSQPAPRRDAGKSPTTARGRCESRRRAGRACRYSAAGCGRKPRRRSRCP